jgi:hypothetical protein
LSQNAAGGDADLAASAGHGRAASPLQREIRRRPWRRLALPLASALLADSLSPSLRAERPWRRDWLRLAQESRAHKGGRTSHTLCGICIFFPGAPREKQPREAGWASWRASQHWPSVAARMQAPCPRRATLELLVLLPCNELLGAPTWTWPSTDDAWGAFRRIDRSQESLTAAVPEGISQPHWGRCLLDRRAR